MSTAVIIAMYGCITIILVIDIEKQIKTQRMLKQLSETMDSHLETCSKVLKKLSKFSNNQEQINQQLKLAENIHWEAIRIIADEIHSRR